MYYGYKTRLFSRPHIDNWIDWIGHAFYVTSTRATDKFHLQKELRKQITVDKEQLPYL